MQPGDMVRLKSGGPRMTINRIAHGGDSAICVWFNNKHERQEDSFALSALDPVDPAEDEISFRHSGFEIDD